MKSSKIKKIIKKIIFSFIIFTEISLLIAQPAQALIIDKLVKGMSANKNAEQLENRYHVDKESVQNFGETFNVGDQKTPAAEVDIFFSPTNPKFGEKVTATAIPKYFQEGSENMYFTWYIKHANSGDDVNEWKVEAMRAIASGGFIKDKADYSSDNDNDGYNSRRGGRVNIQEKDYCYLHDFISGENYEMAIAKVKEGEDDSGCSNGEILCTDGYSLPCGVTNEVTEVPQYNMGGASATGGTGGTGGGDPPSGTGGSGGSSSVNIETPAHQEPTYGTNEIYTDVISDSGDEPECDPNTDSVTCPEGTTALCILNEDLDLLDPSCNQIIPCLEGYSEGSDCDKILNGKVGVAATSCETAVLSEDQIESKCDHNFPEAPGMTVGDGDFGAGEEDFWGTDPHDPSTIDNENSDEANISGLGMDKMTWTFAPGDKVGVIVEGQPYLPTKHDDSSIAIGFALVKNIFNKEGDEGCSIKKGVYAKDIKGFLVEIPFAFVDIDECLEFNLVAPTDGHQADNMEITMDFSPKNPNVGSLGTDSSGKSKGGDQLVVTTNTSDPNVDVNQIYYKWSIRGFKGNREELSLNEGWELLSDDETFRQANNIKLLEGLGMDQLEMQLNTTTVNDVTYDFLRFFVESEEFFDTGTGSTGTTRSGRSDVLVEPNQSGSGGIEITVGANGRVICETGDACEVLENQVITATLTDVDPNSGIANYLWTLDGKNINTLGEDQTKQGNSITFLLAGRPGDGHILSVVANDTAGPGATTDATNKGEKLTLDRHFVVTEPMVEIGPNNSINRGSVMDPVNPEENVCKDLNGNVDSTAVMGTYSTIADPNAPVGEGPQIVNECKESVFNGNGSVTITPSYYPEWISNPPENLRNVKYSVNGTVVESCTSSESCAIDLSTYEPGAMVNISFEAEYWQSDAERLALKDWGVMEGNSGGKKISDSITVKITESTAVGKRASKIIAGLAYNIPEQMIFMFRLMLTVATMIFAAGIIMSLGQKKENIDNF